MDKLFLLIPNFTDERLEPKDQQYYCPHCAMLEGVLRYFPDLDKLLDVVYVHFPRPRKPIVDLVGEENQGCPLLVVHYSKEKENKYPFLKKHNEYLFCNSKYDIAYYLGSEHNIALPHP